MIGQCLSQTNESAAVPKTKKFLELHLENQKNSRFSVTSNLVALAWSIKYRRKQKLITQFRCKSRNESFDPS